MTERLRRLLVPGSLMLRLGIVMGVVLLGILLGFTAWLERLQQEVARQRVIGESNILAHTVAASVTAPLLVKDYAEVERALNRFAAFPLVSGIVVTDAQGNPRGAVVRRNDGGLTTSFDTTRLAVPALTGERVIAPPQPAGGTLLIWHALIEDESSNPGWVRLAYEGGTANGAAADMWREVRYVGALALLLVGASLFAILAGPLRALRRAADFARRLDRLQGATLPAYRGVKEIEQLYAAVNDVSRRLAESADVLRLNASVFENTREGILITDARQDIVQVNAAFTEITGYTPAEVIGRRPGILRSGLHDDAFYTGMWRSLNARGHWRGEIWNRRKDGELYAEILNINAVNGPDGAITHYVGVFGDISDIKATEQRLEKMAHFDRLTDLPNRVLLSDHMRQAIARNQRSGGGRFFAVAFLDLDGFKPVNDTWGHEVGDHLLAQVASRLANAVRGVDTVARLGGDEFVLMLDDLTDTVEIAPTLERVLTAVAAPYVVDGHTLGVTASIGVAVYPRDGEDEKSLLDSADRAMYEAKAAGRNTFRAASCPPAKER